MRQMHQSSRQCNASLIEWVTDKGPQLYIYILQIYWDWIGNGVLITEEAMIISNSHG